MASCLRFVPKLRSLGKGVSNHSLRPQSNIQTLSFLRIPHRRCQANKGPVDVIRALATRGADSVDHANFDCDVHL